MTSYFFPYRVCAGQQTKQAQKRKTKQAKA